MAADQLVRGVVPPVRHISTLSARRERTGRIIFIDQFGKDYPRLPSLRERLESSLKETRMKLATAMKQGADIYQSLNTASDDSEYTDIPN